jgi:hypothetical protein
MQIILPGIEMLLLINQLGQTATAGVGEQAVINPSNDGASAEQSVAVLAVDHTDLIGGAGALAASQTLGSVGLASNTIILDKATEASLASRSLVQSAKDLRVDAASSTR